MIDTHCHIDLYSNPMRILELCERNGITVLAMTNLPSHFEIGYPHVRNYRKVRLALGMHPLYASNFDSEFDCFLSNLHKTSYVGEIGLDFSREGYALKDVQIFFFEKILKAIGDKPKILSIHSRRAEKQVFQELVIHNIRTAVFHWYSGPISLIKDICAHDYYFSINPAMILSENGRKIISRIERSQILTESDGPFVQVEGREVLPSDVILVIDYLAKSWGMIVSEVLGIIKANFHRMLSSIA